MMFPEIETMIADITKKIEGQQTLGIWFDPDGERYCVAILGGDDTDIYSNSDLESCLSGVWQSLYEGR